MKQFNFIKKLMFMPILATVALTSCNENGVDPTSFKLTSSTLPNISTETTVTHSSPSAGEVINITVATEGKLTWKVAATVKTEMFTVTPVGDQNESGTISITVKPNTAFSSRVGRVVISNSFDKVDRVINFTQAASGAPTLTITPSNTVSDIVADGAKVDFSIVVNPVTPLVFEIVDNATWIHAATANQGFTNTWTVDENLSTSPRSGKIAIKYNNGTQALDTLYINQVGAASIPTPEVKADAANVNAQNVLITWTPSPDVLTMSISLNGGTPKIVPCADGKLFVKGLTPSTAYTVTAAGNTANGELDTKTVSFTSKAMTDTYTFKDGKLCENIATWVYALRSPAGTINNVGRLTNGATTYDTLAMIEDLILTYQFGSSANGIVDLLQCPNLTRLQIGRGYYDDGVTVTKSKLDAVLTKVNFPKLTTIQIFAPGIPPANTAVPAAAQTAFQELCTAQGYTFINPMVKALKYPNALPEATTESFTAASVDELGLKDRSAWKVVSWSTQEPTGEGSSGRVAQMLDGDFGTYFHSQWQNMAGVVLALPHEIIIDFGSAISVNKIVMTNRVNGNRDSRPEIYTVSFSSDVPSTYPSPTDLQSAPSFPAPAMNWSAETTVINNSDINSTKEPFSVCTNVFTLPSAVTARCIKIKVTRVQAANLAANWSEFGVK